MTIGSEGVELKEAEIGEMLDGSDGSNGGIC